MEINGAQMFVKALQEEHVDTLFAYPGGTAIDLFDALYDAEGIDMILPRHEQALVHAADGYARSTGKVGVCLVTSGPGATNLVTGIATANYDSVPLVCFTGQVPMNLIGNDAFQEVDIVGITMPVTKHNFIVKNIEELADCAAFNNCCNLFFYCFFCCFISVCNFYLNRNIFSICTNDSGCRHKLFCQNSHER